MRSGVILMRVDERITNTDFKSRKMSYKEEKLGDKNGEPYGRDGKLCEKRRGNDWNGYTARII